MKSLSQSLVNKVLPAFNGKRREKLLASIAVINESLKQGSWVMRGKVKADSGFYQGLTKIKKYSEYGNAFNGIVGTAGWCCSNVVEFVVEYGRLSRPMKPSQGRLPKTEREIIALGLKTIRAHVDSFKVADEIVYAWVELLKERNEAYKFLDEARPKPVITKIGLSPKVSKTLKEMNLDIDLPTIREPDIMWIKNYAIDLKTGEYLINPRTGKKIRDDIPVIKWKRGILHGRSRFAGGPNCHACNKYIPSGMFVPIEAFDKKLKKWVSFWLGCDCARNIFGVKDVGVKRANAKEKS